MITTTAILSIIVFLCAFKFLGLERLGTEILASARSAAGVVRDPNLSDETREKELQRSSIDLFKSFFSILFRGVLCLVLSFVPIWLASLTGLAKMGDVIGFLSRWDVIIIATIIIGAGYVICVRRRPAPSSQPMVENYTFGDRLLHRIAFGAPSMQFVAADIEKSRFNGMYEGVTNPGPIFITSLPRAGTTLMLEVLHRFPNLATHTYRDMPFVMAPILWSRLSGSFKKNAELRERAHGDGMNIGYDSPEAFEEVLWRTFWPEKYTKTHITLWDGDDHKDQARSFLTEHMKKIISLRRPGREQDGRYLSKNNGNIARLDLLCRMFSGARILVPVRHPVEHAASMLRQHLNFLDMHKNNRFVRRYMSDLGHYEFGELHRPMAFPDLDKFALGRDQLKINYWLGYWVAAYEHVIAHRNSMILISYEDTCMNGENALSRICEALDIPAEGMIESAAKLFRTPSPPQGNDAEIDPELRRQAEELHKSLLTHCLTA